VLIQGSRHARRVPGRCRPIAWSSPSRLWLVRGNRSIRSTTPTMG